MLLPLHLWILDAVKDGVKHITDYDPHDDYLKVIKTSGTELICTSTGLISSSIFENMIVQIYNPRAWDEMNRLKFYYVFRHIMPKKLVTEGKARDIATKVNDRLLTEFASKYDMETYNELRDIRQSFRYSNLLNSKLLADTIKPLIEEYEIILKDITANVLSYLMEEVNTHKK